LSCHLSPSHIATLYFTHYCPRVLTRAASTAFENDEEDFGALS